MRIINKTLTKKNYHKEPEKILKENQILNIKNLNVMFKNKMGYVQAVRGIDISLKKGEIIGLVGESGSGKSVSVKSIIGFNEGSKTTADVINLNNIDILSLTKNQWPYIRGTKVGYIPQDPLMALDPTKRIKHQILDAIKITQKRKLDSTIANILESDAIKNKHLAISDAKNNYRSSIKKANMYKRMIDVLNFIGINNPEEAIKSFPHEFSGGMRQRIVIAMTIIGEPDIIIADEPTTALDVTIQAKVIDLIKKLRDYLKVSIIFISHNIALVANLCDYIYVMYAGKIIEKGTIQDIFTRPCHPYTWALIGSIPENIDSQELSSISGTPPNMISPPKGDAFAARNKYAMKIDFEKEPPLFKISDTHFAATWLLHPQAPKINIPSEILTKIKIAKKSINLKKGALNG